ncbi:hypothetical protein HGRIS_013580 [Hohenbuehelia grisea]|uniref:F-box domain-containing protein n=1 Tax=Hohenbuehelia grisea TaxID=104357 RepID=A0ABR3IW78_9AGAR
MVNIPGPDFVLSPCAQKLRLEKLPTELVVEILKLLEFRTLLLCRKTCQLLKSLIDSNASLQYIIELGVSFQTDGPPSSVSCASRLKTLRNHQHAWTRMDWSEMREFPSTDGGLWELAGNVFAQYEEQGGMLFTQLPSKLRGIAEHSWRLTNLNYNVGDFTIDPAQDLLVLIDEPPVGYPAGDFPLRIRLLSMSTGEPHPLAANSGVLEHKGYMCISDIEAAYFIQISSTYIGIHEMIEEEVVRVNRLIVQNWKTGETMLTLESDWENLHLRSFAFLGDRYIMAAVLGHATGAGVIQIYDFVTPRAQHTRNPGFHWTFHFPDQTPDATVWDMHISSNPPPSWEPPVDARGPFFCDLEQRLYVVTVFMDLTTSETLHAHSFDFFIPSVTILSNVRFLPLSHHVPSTCVLWKDWGPMGACALPSNRSPDNVWGCFVYGMKFVDLDHSTEGGGLAIFDFRPFAARRGLQQETLSSSKNGETAGYCISSCLSIPDIFLENLQTHLPFQLVRRPIKVPPSAVMCSEDTMVLVDDDGQSYRILTF